MSKKHKKRMSKKHKKRINKKIGGNIPVGTPGLLIGSGSIAGPNVMSNMSELHAKAAYSGSLDSTINNIVKI
jgi:hypothetical protein